jgi:DNA-binding transcriptional LysR family regulator
MVAEAFDAMGAKPPRATIATSSMATNIQLLTAGRFLALLPASTVFVAAKHQPLKALPVALPDQPKPVLVATLKKRTPKPVATLLIEHARAVARSSMVEE